MSKQFHRLIKKIYWNCFDMNLLVRWMIVLPEVVFDFVFCIKDFTFEGVVPEQTFLPIVGEGGFTDREAVRKFGVGDKSYAVKQRPGFLSEFLATALISLSIVKISFRSSFVCKGIFSAIFLIIVIQKSANLIGWIVNFALNQSISDFAVGTQRRH